MENIKLSENGTIKLNQIARIGKFIREENTRIYSNSINRCKLFLDYYTFISINLENSEFNLEDKKSLKDFLYQFSELFNKLFPIIERYNKSNDLLKYVISYNILNIYNKNRELIEIMILNVLTLGRSIRIHNVDEGAGVY